MVIRTTLADALSQRIITGPVSLGHRFIDDDDGLSLRRVSRREISSFAQRNAHSCEVYGSHYVIAGHRNLPRGDGRAAFDGEAFAAADKSKRDKCDRSGGLHAGKGCHSFDGLLVKGGALRQVRVLLASGNGAKREDPLRVESERSLLDAQETSEQAASANDDDHAQSRFHDDEKIAPAR